MEIWDLYTRDGHPTGETAPRGRPLPQGRFHIVSSVLLRHRDGTYLVMRRDPEKPLHPGRWEATGGGSALTGEDALACAKRELLEETGIPGEDFHEVDVYVSDQNQCRHHCFTASTDRDKTAVTLQPGETVAYRWLTPEALREAIDAGEILSTAMTRWWRTTLP